VAETFATTTKEISIGSVIFMVNLPRGPRRAPPPGRLQLRRLILRGRPTALNTTRVEPLATRRTYANGAPPARHWFVAGSARR
jgi:hypothetical protein